MPSPLITTLASYFTDFFGGPKMITGQQLNLLRHFTTSGKAGLVAKASGGQAGATPLPARINSVDTVANANDSVALPPAIVGLEIIVINNTTTSMQVFGAASNPNNGGAGDTIAIQGSTVQVATGTGVAQAGGVKASYFCATLGQWQRGSTA